MSRKNDLILNQMSVMGSGNINRYNIFEREAQEGTITKKTPTIHLLSKKKAVLESKDVFTLKTYQANVTKDVVYIRVDTIFHYPRYHKILLIYVNSIHLGGESKHFKGESF